MSAGVRFHSPASPGETLLAEAWVASRRRRIYEIKSEVRAAGRLVAEATGTYLAASPTQKTELKRRYGVRPSGTRTGKGVS